MNTKLMSILTTGVLLLAGVGTAQADHGPAGKRARLAETAHVLENRSAHLARFASRFVDPWNPRERRLQRDLDRLAWEARSFHRNVESRRFRGRSTVAALDDLLFAYERASRSLARTRMPRPVYGKFDRLGHLVDDSARLTLRLARSPYRPRPVPREFRAYGRYADDDDDRFRDRRARYARPRTDRDFDDDDDDDGRRGRRRIDD